MQPTEEQAEAVTLFAKGESMVIEAGAGTGKTSTLQLVAENAHGRNLRGRYMAFNKAVVTDVQGRMPVSCAASTAHSLAMRSVGRPYAHRLTSGRMQSWVLAEILGIDPYVVTFDAKHRKRLAAPFLAGLVMRGIGNYCKTDEEEPTRRHVPYLNGIDLPTDSGDRTYANNNALAVHLEPFLRVAWADITKVDGSLPFKHDHYLKLWQLSHPRTEVDYLLFDEAQDANPVMAAVVAEQTHCQLVYVGDSNQAIYEWTGAVNALGNIESENRRLLTQSFRFGDAIAAAANVILDTLPTELRLRGLPSIDSAVTILEPDDADAILCRTNAGAMTAVLDAQDRGSNAALVGGGKEIVSFARAAKLLMENERTGHPELSCFESWSEVQEYVEQDAQGNELKLMVDLVDKYGVATIITALDRAMGEAAADLIVSTAHKAKGREWNAVLLHSDFASFGRPKNTAAGDPTPEPSHGEKRLRYVATTRAKLQLDNSALHPKGVKDAPNAPSINRF